MPIRLSKVPKCGALEVLIPSWQRSLRPDNNSPPTIRADGDAARLFDQFCSVSFGQLTIDQITREHIETFIANQLERFKPTTASLRYRSLQQCCKWLIEEGGIAQSPMANMKSPIVPEVPVPVVTDTDRKSGRPGRSDDRAVEARSRCLPVGPSLATFPAQGLSRRRPRESHQHAPGSPGACQSASQGDPAAPEQVDDGIAPFVHHLALYGRPRKSTFMPGV